MTKKKIINIIKLILIFFIFYYSSYIKLTIAYLLNLNIKKLTNYQNIILIMITDLILLLILFLIYKKDLKKEFKIFKDNLETNIDIGFKYWFIGILIMYISNIFINIILKNGQAANEKAVQNMISTAPYIMILNAGIIAPIIEELVFRKSFYDAINNKKLFVIISGLIFGSLHVITSVTSNIDYLYIIPYSSLGISLAYMYKETKTIYTSITMHMIHNLILVIISIL